jgi:hypothetical protein
MRRWIALIDYWTAALLYILINIIVFHGGWYKYLCEPKSYAGNVYGRLEVLKSVERSEDKKPIALVGDSITEEGIDAELVSEWTGRPVVNLALPGTSPLDWSFFLRAIDPEQNRFDRIVLTVIPQTVRSQAHEDGIQTLLPVASPFLMREYLATRKKRTFENDYLAFDRIYAFRRDLRDFILSPSRWFAVRTARLDKLKWILNYEGETYDVCKVRVEGSKVIQWGKIKDPEVRRLIRHNVNRITKLNYAPEVAGITGPLKQIAETYAKSGTKIIVVNVPFGPGHRVRPQSPPVSRYLNELSVLGAKGKVIHWTAFEEPFYHECSNFFDYRHLNHKGRRIFSKWLSVQLKGEP